MDLRYYARSANDKTDNWPFWLVADRKRGGLNVTADLMEAHFPTRHKPGAVFLSRDGAVYLAAVANGQDHKASK